jgi:hypothetical protein
MGAFEPREELHFAKVENTEDYAVIHSIFTGNLLFPGKSQYRTNLSYNEFVLYFAGACFAKNDERFHLYNGIPKEAGNNLSPSLKFSSLDNNELEKLLIDVKLEDNLKKNIKTID